MLIYHQSGSDFDSLVLKVTERPAALETSILYEPVSTWHEVRYTEKPYINH